MEVDFPIKSLLLFSVSLCALCGANVLEVDFPIKRLLLFSVSLCDPCGENVLEVNFSIKKFFDPLCGPTLCVPCGEKFGLLLSWFFPINVFVFLCVLCVPCGEKGLLLNFLPPAACLLPPGLAPRRPKAGGAPSRGLTRRKGMPPCFRFPSHAPCPSLLNLAKFQ